MRPACLGDVGFESPREGFVTTEEWRRVDGVEERKLSRKARTQSPLASGIPLGQANQLHLPTYTLSALSRRVRGGVFLF